MNADRLLATSPGRLAAFLGHGVSADLVERLVQTPRLRAGLAGLITSRLGALGPLDPMQAKIMAMSQQDVADLAAKAGAVWHAGSIAQIIDGAKRRVLVGLLGEEHYKLALAAATERPNERPTDRLLAAPLADTPEAIAEAVVNDGAACLAAWCAHQPPALRGRLDLMRPPALPGPAHAAAGPQIIARLLAS
jgi:hypothetical protein